MNKVVAIIVINAPLIEVIADNEVGFPRGDCAMQ
jgi:hypothetical protein